MSELTRDPGFFYAIAFGVFIVLAFVYGRKPILAWLDGQIAKIRHELDAARDLRAEAEAALADSKAKQARAEADAKEIIATAKEQIDEIREEAAEALRQALKRHEQLAAERIRVAEAQAIADVRAAAIDMALSMARENITKNLSDAAATGFIDQAIAEIPSLAGVRKTDH